MSNKKRFFYVISSLGSGQVTTSAVRRIDGTIFNANELRRQIANENFIHVDNVYIADWHEFENEQDFLGFFK